MSLENSLSNFGNQQRLGKAKIEKLKFKFEAIRT
jgi:hypothetical protein